MILLRLFNPDIAITFCDDVLLVFVELRGFVGLYPSLAIARNLPPQSVLVKCAVHLAACHGVALCPLRLGAPSVLSDGNFQVVAAPCAVDSGLTIQFCHLAHVITSFCLLVSVVMYSVWALACRPFRDSILPERKTKINSKLKSSQIVHNLMQ